MKKILPLFLSLMAWGTVYALPLGNPAEASSFGNSAFCSDSLYQCQLGDFSLRIGFYGDYVFNRNLKTGDRVIPNTVVPNENNSLGLKNSLEPADVVIKKTTILTNAGYLALNFCDRIDVFGTFGATRLNFTGKSSGFIVMSGDTPPGGDYIGWNEHQYDELITNSGISLSMGTRATLCNWCGFTLGVEGQYFVARPEITTYISAAFGSEAGIEKEQVTYEEWQVGLGLAYHYSNCYFDMMPYMGVKWADASFDADSATFTPTVPLRDTDVGTITVPRMCANKHWGYAVGVSLNFCDMFALLAEGRFADETAFHVKGQMQF